MQEDINVTAYGRHFGKVLKQQQDIMRSQKVMVICCTPRRRTIKNLAMKKRLYDLVEQGGIKLVDNSNNPEFQREYLAEFIDK